MGSKDLINWEYLQNNSNDILGEGLNKLISSPYNNFGNKYPGDFGNYIISYGEQPLYIGEATNINKRLKDHYRGNTFYKNYKKYGNNLGLPTDLKIDDFQVQYSISHIGRKEIEEFGIVNLPAPLNKFQLDKRERFTVKSSQQLWDEIQENAENLLLQAEEIVFSKQAIPWERADIGKVPGVYVIYNYRNELIYIGESTNLLKRNKTHSAKTRFSAFRRHVATDILSFEMKTKRELGFDSNDTKRNFVTEKEDMEISEYINGCKVIMTEINFGRLELEEYLIHTLRPVLNSKGNK